MDEGKQYFVNRITFVGNTTTRDTVVRREMRLFENGVFNTEALKYSIKRINQLGYFKALEGGKDVDVEKTPGTDNKVDVTLKFEEQNRNQLTFGAGVSQYEGFFGQLGFQTANFMGRGETFSVNLQAGSRAQNYQVGVHRAVPVRPRDHGRHRRLQAPAAIHRPVHAGLGRRQHRLRVPAEGLHADVHQLQPTSSTKVSDLNPIVHGPGADREQPVPGGHAAARRGAARGRSARSSPSVVDNTIDNPIFPTRADGILCRSTWRAWAATRTSSSRWSRASGTCSTPSGPRSACAASCSTSRRSPGSKPLPIFEKLFLGGEYSVRGFDIRTIGPKAVTPATPTFGQPFVAGVAPAGADGRSGLVIGGNKTLLFNAEYLISIAGPVRLVLFYDAGQARDEGQHFAFERVQDVDGRGDPVLHAGAERAVPPDLRLQPAARRASWTTTCSRRSTFAFRFAVGSTF